ncbi:YhcN/YlaJ family sporulation lipoprotein [Eubacteriales bacterium OttesenSCG-928-N13]|nr:YhcN/YlaJ family sporulation lipoprotein [Eubacteriales bacterium OttesenSCG-928-N13]
MNKNKKTILTVTMILVMCFLMAGCFNSTNEPTEVPNETINPDGAPMVTTEPGVMITPIPEGTNAPMMPFDWSAQSSAVEGRINMFSEIQESHVVTCEQTALVGIKFTSSYKGELTQRIRDMIAGEVMAADSNITVVAVTADPSDVASIIQLKQRKDAGASDAEIKPEVEQIAKNTNTMR